MYRVMRDGEMVNLIEIQPEQVESFGALLGATLEAVCDVDTVE